MSNYRRSQIQGSSYFFTVVSYRRQPILCDTAIRNALRRAIDKTRQQHPFTIDAWVLLPDHLHCIWTLPGGDADYAKCRGIIKRRVNIECRSLYRDDSLLTDSIRKHRESTTWQHRYWAHQLRDQHDFNRHMDYIHYKPVKHGLCAHPNQWPYSTLHRLN
ncbi:transposase [Solemya pervernicosa gill symbiont]|uniref:Transposase n=1 Tax=Solemya pervernicosa gill symbiont TaxID=642797 RepID=A0A1T2KZ15_9GAMM|nr:transposase [Solemya pervernicosa gill symbiont]OOZ38085.1 transposase [Solemya pervernicosa gill symbiont]